MKPQFLWKHLSSATGDLPVPPGSDQQTLCLVADLDRDGRMDILIGCRNAPPALVWYRQEARGKWRVYVVEAASIPLEAGGALADIDGDGDLDIVAGGDYRHDTLYWWENPYPRYAPDKPWKHHLVKTGEGVKHHDQLFGDFDGDGKLELVFWNQGAGKLFWAPIPKDPRADEWGRHVIFEGAGEGLAKADIDGDGRDELLAGGRWFDYESHRWTHTLIDPAQSEPRIAAADLDGDGQIEVVMVPGDANGRLTLYRFRDDPHRTENWSKTDLLRQEVVHGHTLALADFDRDGKLDIFCAEMRRWTADDDNPQARAWILLNSGKGGFTPIQILSGYDWHEGRVADIDGNGMPDLVCKPYNWQTPRLDIWLLMR
ncbi:MAG: VCBS repeat-containing protein [Armatimonadota bacterium]|nr:VCBS repeat-containing protein [bacterium]MDW8290040.1 VCBS repeat-containing protein [Armatimonadota bacterium]